MIESHVATFAGLRLPRFVCGEGVAGVAGIAGGRAELRAMLLQVGDLSRCLQTGLWRLSQDRRGARRSAISSLLYPELDAVSNCPHLQIYQQR
jgi:hypothetical protein